MSAEGHVSRRDFLKCAAFFGVAFVTTRLGPSRRDVVGASETITLVPGGEVDISPGETVYSFSIAEDEGRGGIIVWYDWSGECVRFKRLGSDLQPSNTDSTDNRLTKPYEWGLKSTWGYESQRPSAFYLKGTDEYIVVFHCVNPFDGRVYLVGGKVNAETGEVVGELGKEIKPLVDVGEAPTHFQAYPGPDDASILIVWRKSWEEGYQGGLFKQDGEKIASIDPIPKVYLDTWVVGERPTFYRNPKTGKYFFAWVESDTENSDSSSGVNRRLIVGRGCFKRDNKGYKWEFQSKVVEGGKVGLVRAVPDENGNELLVWSVLQGSSQRLYHVLKAGYVPLSSNDLNVESVREVQSGMTSSPIALEIANNIGGPCPITWQVRDEGFFMRLFDFSGGNNSSSVLSYRYNQLPYRTYSPYPVVTGKDKSPIVVFYMRNDASFTTERSCFLKSVPVDTYRFHALWVPQVVNED